MRTCTVPGCREQMKEPDLMCREHWGMLSQEIKAQIVDSFETGNAGTKEHYALCVKAVRHVYKKTKENR